MENPGSIRAFDQAPFAGVSRRTAKTVVVRLLSLLVGTALIVLVSCGDANGPKSAASTNATADSIPWKTDLDAAFAQSKQTGKPVLVDFSASWCPPCQEMKHTAWPDPRVGRIVKSDYIPVLLDADEPASQKPGTRYGVQSIPAILVLDASGNVIRQGDFMTADQLVAFLQKGSKPDKSS